MGGRQDGRPRSHGKPSTLPLAKITANTIPKSLSQLLADGEVGVTIGADALECLGKLPYAKRLFPDFK